MLKILFFTHPTQDYLADSILHGLKTINDVVVYDYPRKEVMYKTDKHIKGITGNGMTLYYLIEIDNLNRFGLFHSLLHEKPYIIFDELMNKKYDIVIFSNISQQFGYFVQFLPFLKKNSTIILDGEDTPALYPYYGFFWRRPFFWFLPRAHKRFKYFKREWLPDTKYYRYFKLIPRSLLKFIPEPINLHKISYSIPEEKIIKTLPVKTKLFPKHIVDKQIAGKIEGSYTKYAFENEEDYYNDLQSSKFGITTKRSGWDCLRHYEIAANGTVICFKDLDKKPETCAPHGLIPGINCISYKNYDDLMNQISTINDERYIALQSASLIWIKNNTTITAASKLIENFNELNKL